MFLNGKQRSLAEMLGAHVDADGRTRFRVWAPRATAVAVVLGDDGGSVARVPMALGDEGVWQVADVDAPVGSAYRFAVTDGANATVLKADPMARQAARRPSGCSIVTASTHTWRDQDWMAARARAALRDQPLSIYELHLGTWRRSTEDPGRERPFAELAGPLADHVTELGFTHVELMPITAHPFPGSWGYQTTSYFAPDPRHGEPDDLRALIDLLHQRGIGVLLDWVPGHFPADAWALARFDGTPTYEHPDPRRGTQPTWGSLVFDYGRPEVQSFLLSSAHFWLKEFHVDGLRIDAVASMLRHDWGRPEGQVLANADGSLEHHEAVSFLRELTALVPEAAPGAVTIAEEASGHPGVTAAGGLGFTFAWNMGWTTDWLGYFGSAPATRRQSHNEITFASSYADAEHYVLGLSHDEVHDGSLASRMWGDQGQRLAGVRALLALQWAHRGKKLLFMGCEFGQEPSWTHHRSLDWSLLEDESGDHRCLLRLVAALGEQYRGNPALWSLDGDAAGMRWLAADDAERSTYAFMRQGGAGERLLCVANLGDDAQPAYAIDGVVADGGSWNIVLDTDAARFGGGGRTRVTMQGSALHLDLAPLSCVWLSPGEAPHG